MSTIKTNTIQTTTSKTILASTGSILKVASNTLRADTSTSSSSYVASGLITTITPVNSGSNFYVTLLAGRHGSVANVGTRVRMYVSVNGGAYASALTGDGGETLLYANSSNIQAPLSHSLLYVPGTSVTTISFQPYYSQIVGAGTVFFNYYDVNSYGEPTLTVFEISA